MPFPHVIDQNIERAESIELPGSQLKGGTRMLITESGFDQNPIERRSQSFHASD